MALSRYLILVALLLVKLKTSAQVSVIKIADFERLSSQQNDTTYIFNFWATWCKPCVKELPSFEEINKKYANKKVKVMLISLDFIKDLNSRLVPFVNQNQIKSKVYLIDEPDYNSWINKVDSAWGGGIPVTLIINNQQKIHSFYEKEFTTEELEAVIK